MPEQELSQEEIAARLAEELKKIKIEDVLVNTLVQISAIGYRRLGLSEDTADERELEQSRLAIETMRALVPVLEGFLPPELVQGFQEQIATMQLAYAQAATAPIPAAEAASRGQTPGHAPKDPDDGENP